MKQSCLHEWVIESFTQSNWFVYKDKFDNIVYKCELLSINLLFIELFIKQCHTSNRVVDLAKLLFRGVFLNSIISLLCLLVPLNSIGNDDGTCDQSCF